MCPLMSAGPPFKINDINIPSPSFPPTILKPKPLGPFINSIVSNSLKIELYFKNINNYNR
jgi:hypothetical protein